MKIGSHAGQLNSVMCKLENFDNINGSISHFSFSSFVFAACSHLAKQNIFCGIGFFYCKLFFSIFGHNLHECMHFLLFLRHQPRAAATNNIFVIFEQHKQLQSMCNAARQTFLEH